MKAIKPIRFSIRSKIILLIVGALLLSGTGYILLGSRLIIEDKTAYIYDYSADQVSLIAESLNDRLAPLSTLADQIENKTILFDSPLFKSICDFMKVSATLGTVSTTPASEKIELDANDPEFVKINFNLKNETLLFHDKQLTLHLDNMPRDLNICAFSQKSKKVIFKFIPAKDVNLQLCEQAIQNLKASFLKGAQSTVIDQKSYILTYQSILNDEMMVIGLVSSDLAFSSAKKLYLRSLILGLSLFLLSIGLALLLIRTLILRIQKLNHATLEIGKGNFEVDLSSDSSSDEIGLLSHAFTSMSAKIKQLLAETETKVRMEKELETAQLVQRNFLPQSSYSEDGIWIDGISLSATECGGDFWQFIKIQKYVLLVFGDITGHGVPAALLTATVHGVLSSFSQMLNEGKPIENVTEEVLKPLSKSLNHAIFNTSHSSADFPCIIGMFDPYLAQFFILNFGHPRPYLWNESEKEWINLKSSISSPLGTKTFQVQEPNLMDLKEGASFIFYTDGLYELKAIDGKSIRKKDLLEFMREAKLNVSPSHDLAKKIMNYTLQFFGSEASARPDDITVVQLDFTPKS